MSAVAARTASVHLYSNYRKLGWTRTHKQRHHHVPQGPFSLQLTDYQKPTRNPQAMPIVQHSLDNTKRHTMMSMVFHHTTTQPTSCVGGAYSPPHNQPFTHWQPLQPAPGCWTRLWWRGHCKRSKVTLCGVAPTPTHTTSTGPSRPNSRHQSLHQLAHTCTEHGQLGIPTCKIMLFFLRPTGY